MTNPFIKTVTKRRVTSGKKILAGGTEFHINYTNRNFLTLSLNNGVTQTPGGYVGMGVVSLRELADTLTEICDVMEGK